MFYLLIMSIVIVALATVLLSISILIKKGGRFPSTHIEENGALRKKGISCVRSQDREAVKSQGLSQRLKEECE